MLNIMNVYAKCPYLFGLILITLLSNLVTAGKVYNRYLCNDLSITLLNDMATRINNHFNLFLPTFHTLV